MSRGEVFKKWEQEQTVVVKTRLHKVHDADIIKALEQAEKDGEQKATAVKRMMRIAIEVERSRM